MNTLLKSTNSAGKMPANTFSGLVDKIFQNNVNRFFDDSFWGLDNVPKNISVPVNVKETDKSYELELIAPGLKKEDFKINVHGDILTVSFEQREEKNQQNEEESWLRRDYIQRSFTRTFHLDEAIEANRIDAKYSEGVLHLTLPKKEGAQTVSRSIQIK